jgi:hypothetical protein
MRAAMGTGGLSKAISGVYLDFWASAYQAIDD